MRCAMNSKWTQVKEMFTAALEIEALNRDSFLREACAGDETLRAEVSGLLSAHLASGDFLKQSAIVDIGLIANDDSRSNAAVLGQEIGSYKIIRELGRGGMGAVYLAARADESFDKEVALKLIKRGMDSD